jgi:hypothetical protein
LVFLFQQALFSNRANKFNANSKPTPYSALQPYAFIKVDSTPRAEWVHTDFHNGVIKPESLSTTAFSYSTLPAVYRFSAQNWEAPRIAGPDDAPLAEASGALAFTPLSDAPVPFSGTTATSATAVPEPSTAAFLAALCAFLAILGYQRIAKPAPKLE